MLAVMQPKRSNGLMHVLIIDDEESIRRTTAMALEGMGYETTGAETRAAALKQLEYQAIAELAPPSSQRGR